jgi:predicted metal-binding protein
MEVLRMDKWIEIALAAGFDDAAPLDIATLKPRPEVRDMCRADSCRAYGKNWTCPPHCGSLADCQQQMQQFQRGLLLQTVGHLRKTIDTKCYQETEQRHLRQFAAFCQELKAAYPQALCLGSGGCRVCQTCAWPQPCRFPEKAYCSMEGYGLFVTQVCRDNGLSYHHGEKTITYTACILF